MIRTHKRLRAIIVASSSLLLVATISPLAQADSHGKSGDKGKSAEHGKSGEHGKKSKGLDVNSILKEITSSPVFNGKGKKFENEGNALKAQSNELAKKLLKLTAGNAAATVAVTSYLTAVDSATATFQSSVKAAKATFKAAVAAATTDSAKQSAETAYKAAVAAAQQTFQAAIQAANAALKSALLAILPSSGVPPSPSPSPSST